MTLLEFKRMLYRATRLEHPSLIDSFGHLIRILVNENESRSFIVGGSTDSRHDFVGAIIGSDGRLLGSCVHVGFGRVLTAYHVVARERSPRVTFGLTFRQGPMAPAKIVDFVSSPFDLALLSIEASSIPHTDLGRPPLPTGGLAVGYGHTWDGLQLSGEGLRRSAYVRINRLGNSLKLTSSAASVCWYDSGGAVVGPDRRLYGIMRQSKDCELGYATSLLSGGALGFVAKHGL